MRFILPLMNISSLINWEEHFYISPPFNKKSQKKIKVTSKFLDLHIEDSLKNNTTYLSIIGVIV